MPSLAFLLPDARLWGRDEPVIFTPSKNYTVHNYKEFFDDIGYPEGYQMYLATKPIVDGFVGPTGVDEVYCFYGTGVPTTAGMVYGPATRFYSDFPDQNPSLLVEDGDGTVNMRSLQQCLKWQGVRHETFPKADHLGIMRDKRFIARVKQIANANKVPPKPRSLIDLIYGYLRKIY